MRKNKMIENEEKVLPSEVFQTGKDLLVINEEELILSSFDSLLTALVEFNAEMPTNGTDVAIAKIKQAIEFFNKQV